jgi:Helix-hairpin-helix containing domain
MPRSGWSARTEPYRLAADVLGIAFKTADTIAEAVGIPHDSPQRVMAGLQFTLSEATSDGHCFLPEQDLIREAITILQVDTGLVIDCLAELVAEQGVVRELIPDAVNRWWRCSWCCSTVRRSPWPVSCGHWPALMRTGCLGSRVWIGIGCWGGCTGEPAPSWRRSRRRRCGWR